VISSCGGKCFCSIIGAYDHMMDQGCPRRSLILLCYARGPRAYSLQSSSLVRALFALCWTSRRDTEKRDDTDILSSLSFLSFERASSVPPNFQTSAISFAASVASCFLPACFPRIMRFLSLSVCVCVCVYDQGKNTSATRAKAI